MQRICLLAIGGMLVGCSETGINADEKVDFEPNDRPDRVEQVVDVYTQTNPTQADVLFVISNWWSMEQAYAELVDAFDDLLQVFVGSGVDYHFGVISTDTDHAYENGKLHEKRGYRFIDEQTDDPIGVFAEMATMNASGCVGPRRPRDATFLAFEVQDNDWNKGFRRDDASVHTVFVSDDRDSSLMHTFDEWVSWYDNFTNTKEIDTLSTIVDLQKDTDNPRATEVIGGMYHPIEDQPWANVLEEIGLRAQGLKQEYFLSRQPDVESIEIKVIPNGSTAELAFGLGDDFDYDASRNSVQFQDYEPPEGSEIRIEYDAL